MRRERSERKIKSMVEKMMMMPHMHAIEMPFANFWWYICVLVFCVSVVTVFLFADKFVPQITMWNTCNLPIPSFLTHITKIRLRYFKNLCLSIYMRTSYLPTDTLYPFTNLPTILPLSPLLIYLHVCQPPFFWNH
jgi:hypothetical protein